MSRERVGGSREPISIARKPSDLATYGTPATAQTVRILAISYFAREPASVCIVLPLPEFSVDLEREISLLLSDLRKAQRHHLGLTVAVSQNPVDWNACTGIEGFVSADVKARVSA